MVSRLRRHMMTEGSQWRIHSIYFIFCCDWSHRRARAYMLSCPMFMFMNENSSSAFDLVRLVINTNGNTFSWADDCDHHGFQSYEILMSVDVLYGQIWCCADLSCSYQASPLTRVGIGTIWVNYSKATCSSSGMWGPWQTPSGQNVGYKTWLLIILGNFCALTGKHSRKRQHVPHSQLACDGSHVFATEYQCCASSK